MLTQKIPQDTQVIKLGNNNQLAYSIFGSDKFEKPILYLHGFPGSRYEILFAQELAENLDLTLIGIDRPGYGLSNSYPHRKLTDWPVAIKTLCRHLRLKHPHLIACSGGAPYALACARYIPEMLQSCNIISGLGPCDQSKFIFKMNWFNFFMVGLARDCPLLAKFIVNSLGAFFSISPQLMIKWLQIFSPHCDRRILSNPSVSSILYENFNAGLNSKYRNLGQDLCIIARPWGFNLSEIKMLVHFWHGQADDYVPYCMAEFMHQQILNSTLNLVPAAGHFMAINLIDKILKTL